MFDNLISVSSFAVPDQEIKLPTADTTTFLKHSNSAAFNLSKLNNVLEIIFLRLQGSIEVLPR